MTTQRSHKTKKSGTKQASAQHRKSEKAIRESAPTAQKADQAQNGSTAINPSGFAPEEEAALAEREKIGIPVSGLGKAIVKQLRAAGATTETVKQALRHEAHGLDDLADRLTPSPEVRDSMLKDALEVLDAASAIFEHDGDSSDLLSEALRSAEDDFELFEYASGNGSGGADQMAYIRAQYRVRLALKLAAFQAKHPTWKPAKAESDVEQGEQAAGGAS